MRYDRTVLLPGGQSCVIRNPEAEDAGEILSHLIQTSDETPYLARSGGEIKLTHEEEKKFLASLADSPRSLMLAAYLEGALAGNSGFDPAGGYERFRFRAIFGISVKKDFWGIGVGSALMEANISAAREAGYKQLELEVSANNRRAIALYEKYGFQIYGTRPGTIAYADGSFAPAHLMLLEL